MRFLNTLKCKETKRQNKSITSQTRKKFNKFLCDVCKLNSQ